MSHCHYGDFDPQPLLLTDGVDHIFRSSYVTYYNGYDNYIFRVEDSNAEVNIVVKQFQPDTSIIYVSQKAPQPDPSNFTWVFSSQSYTITGNATNPLSGRLYFGVSNSNSVGYSINVSVKKK
jgi:hypothetical protein